MKKFISMMLILCLCLSLYTSFTFAADQDVSDSTTHTRLQTIINWLQNYAPTYNQMSTIASSLSTIVNWSSRNGVLYNLNDNLITLMGWLDPANGGSTSALLNQILNALVYSDAGGAAVSYLTDLKNENQTQTNHLAFIRQYTQDVSNGLWANFALHYKLPGANGTQSSPASGQTNFMNMIQDRLTHINSNLVDIYTYEFAYLANGYNIQQSLVNYADPESTVTFTPSSVTDGLFKYLNALNTPLSRLGYVLASDERIEAQDLASANEQTVVDNFIDSSGSGAASTSDFSSVSGLSSGFKDNISTDANVSGIWNIFNSDNFGWFSQETANQLDTTGSNRTLRSSGSYSTPLLDQQTEEILKYIGGDNND